MRAVSMHNMRCKQFRSKHATEALGTAGIGVDGEGGLGLGDEECAIPG